MAKTEKKVEEKPKTVSYATLFRYASGFDIFLMVVGLIVAIGNGAALPVMTIFFGDIFGAFIVYTGTEASREAVSEAVKDGVIKMCLIGVVTFTASYLQMACWMIAGENQAMRIRFEYFQALMRQDIGWYDKEETGTLTSRLTKDIHQVQEGLSEKVGLLLQFSASFIAGFVIGFTRGWQLSLVLCSVFPLLAGAAFMMNKVLAAGATKGSAGYGLAGSIAQQAISSVRTVTAFGGQEREVARYNKGLDEAEQAGLKNAMFNGLGVATIQGLIFLVYALAFWYGNKLIPDTMNAGAVLNVFFSIIIGAFSLGNATPHISAIGTACGAAYHLFETIDRKSPIDALDESGKTPEKLSGHIVAKGVAFAYPTRPDVPILEDFNLEIPAGKTVALVGMSGSGKSTIVKLVERFYDPTKGTVTIDGIDVKDLNVRWLRSQVGIVSQEPILFNCSIRQNILYGLENGGEGIEPSRLDSMIEEALKTSNAWDFIQKLPNKLDTFVGEAGSMMSGGQKQRIAIARAIIKNPKILLLDEATSALDTESERIVQSALDKASANRTTIAIAHRLSTVKHADKIVVMDRGKIVEMGNHKELVEMKGVYASLVENQELQMFDAVEKIEEPVIKAVEPTPERVIVQVGGDAKSEKAKSIKEEAKKDEPKPDTSRYMKLSRPEWPLFFIGGFAAAVNGVVMPLFSIVFSSLLTALGTNEANNWALYFVFLSIAAFISNFCQVGLFGYAGVKLTRRLRELVFRTILKQEMGFFDRPEHATGILTAKLAEDASQIQALTGVAYGSLAQALAGVIAGLVIAFTACWQLALVILALIPLIGLAGYMQLKTLTGFGAKSKIAYEDASQIATESVANIRTVATLGQEKTFYNNFVKKCQSPHKITIRGAQLSAIGFSFSQAVPFLSWALAFWYGSLLLKWGLYTSKPILNTMFAIIFTAMAAGQSNSHAPDAAKAKVAAVSIAELLDRVSEIDPTTEKGEKRDTIEGKAAVSNVTFAYPTRPENKIVTDISIEAKPGQVVALVGASGCGKSTMIALLERWYDVVDGAASVDDMDVRKWELQNLRSHLALVGQEPVLFNMTIRENIAYGYPSEVDDARIYDVAKMANIHDFVMTLPQGYDTLVGEKGGQLSGGQKQRIAIARALIRNPKLLLLDEATSALDSESEKVVQAALDAASKGRTTIVIAHRLSTIKDADLICVLSKGNVIERGTHQSLVEARGEYFKLVQQQSLA